jgi:hypothetical protein
MAEPSTLRLLRRSLGTWRFGDVDLGIVGWAPMPPVWIWRNPIAVGIAVAPPSSALFRSPQMGHVAHLFVVESQWRALPAHSVGLAPVHAPPGWLWAVQMPLVTEDPLQ